ncbi:MAG: ATP-binding cassette domain-containing protein [Planctomycetota bacterium]|nr:ATP-binding cassette domain-containing protein [Planctomycetaceae bacterium]MDQ3331825.1 ATP-binding cassette domain-containing protein [Planctomycetota bacterium]
MTARLWTFDRVNLAGRPTPRLVDASLSIATGVTAIVGPSGAGKTSLLNLLVGYEQSASGRIDRAEAPTGRLAYFWGPQDDGLWPGVSVRRHLELVQPSQAHETVEELLEAFDLRSIADATPERLSRGEASRVAVARAIASEAHVLVLDEPLSHVDPARRTGYWARLLNSIRDRASSLVFASHEPTDVLRYAEHVIGMREARVVFAGDVRTLYAMPPDVETASLLGPTNWLTVSECESWRIEGRAESSCVRPERLQLETTADGPASVVASRAGGAVEESELRCEATGEVRRFLHRPTCERLVPGARVRLTVLALLATALFSGCDAGADGPLLEIASERRISLPVKGADLPGPRAVAVGHHDEKIVLDNAGRVLVYDSGGTLTRQWDMPESSVGNPEGVCVLADGRVCVADTHYHRVVFFDPEGNVTGMFGELGREPGQFIYPVAVTVDPSGNLYVAEYGENDRIQKFGPDNGFLQAFGSFGTGEGQFQRPSGIVWLDGKIYAVDAFNSRVHVFKDSGDYEGLLDTKDVGLHYPYDLALGPDRRLYVVEYGAGRVTVLTTDGDVVGRVGSTGSGQAQFATPWGLAVDSIGRIWVADTGNRRIVELVPKEAEGLQSLRLAGGTS